jgi:anti-sigma B factor antagonist
MRLNRRIFRWRGPDRNPYSLTPLNAAGNFSGKVQAGERPRLASGAHDTRVLEMRQRLTAEGYVVCSPVGEVEAYTVASFRDALAELATSDRLVIDMSFVTFVDSAGLGALIGGIRRTRDLGGNVAVACGRPTIRKLLHNTGFDRIVAVTETVEEAATALRAYPLDDQPRNAASA